MTNPNWCLYCGHCYTAYGQQCPACGVLNVDNSHEAAPPDDAPRFVDRDSGMPSRYPTGDESEPMEAVMRIDPNAPSWGGCEECNYSPDGCAECNYAGRMV